MKSVGIFLWVALIFSGQSYCVSTEFKTPEILLDESGFYNIPDVGSPWSNGFLPKKIGIYQFMKNLFHENPQAPVVKIANPLSKLLGRQILLRDPALMRDAMLRLVDGGSFSKKDSFFPLQQILGERALLSGNAGMFHHKEKKELLKETVIPSKETRHFAVIEKHSQRLLSRWASLPHGLIDNVYSDVKTLTLSIITDLIFGVDSMDQTEINEILDYNTQMAAMIPLDALYQLSYFNWARSFYIKFFYKRYLENKVRLEEHIRELIAMRDQTNPMLYVNRVITDPDHITSEQVSDLLTAYLAGHDTTTAFITFFLESISFDEELQARIRENIRSTMRGVLTYEDIGNFVELKSAMDQHELKMPPVGATARDVVEPVVLEGNGYRVQLLKGDQVILPLGFVNSSENPWVDRRRITSYTFLQMSRAHGCPGQTLAKFEFRLFMALFLSRFHIAPVSETKVVPMIKGAMAPSTTLSLRLKGL